MIASILIVLAATPPPAQPINGVVQGATIIVGVTAPPAASQVPTAPAQQPGYPKTSLVAACPLNNACSVDLDCIGGTPYWIFSQASAQAEPVNTDQSVCVHTTPAADVTTIPDAVVTEARASWAAIALPVEQPEVQPAERSVVGVPTLFLLRGAAATDWDLTLEGIPLHIHAQETYSWDFGDGATLQTTIRGRRYDQERPPADAAYAGEYVQHAYDDAATRRVVVTATWSRVTLTRTDSGASVALPGRASTGNGATVRVTELRSVLTTP